MNFYPTNMVAGYGRSTGNATGPLQQKLDQDRLNMLGMDLSKLGYIPGGSVPPNAAKAMTSFGGTSSILQKNNGMAKATSGGMPISNYTSIGNTGQSYSRAPGMSGEGGIYSPTRTTIGQAANTIRSSGLIPKFKPVGDLTGLDDSYYNLLSDQASKRLRKQYFTDESSILGQRENQIKHRGLFGSGIGEAATSDVYKSFGDEMADIESDLMSKRMESDVDVKKFNIENAFRNNQMESDLARLLMEAASDEARTATDFDTRMFEQQVNLKKSDQEQIAKIIGSLGETLGQENIDPDTRDYFESIFGSYVGDMFGHRPNFGSR